MSNSEEALKEKELGNAAYKKRNFEEALAHYRKGLELDPTDMRFILNEAAVLYEQKNYEECAKTALKAVEVGRANRADYKLIAKAFSRAALAYRQDEKTYDLAKKYYESSLAEHRTPETKAKLSEVEKLIKEKIEREYRDPEKAEQERARGNELFKEGRYPEAIKAYTESIKRNPDEAKTYSNRAACYNKLTEYDLGLRDCNKCIELDSQFVKGHVRKGMLLKAKGQFEKALECFQRALELDEHNAVSRY
ncbi:Stress-induced-phosphoprotein 1 [Amphibalanus amphitrite]|uniref:Stress-induced-phosphoprotein 1 n=1 Tax=Amphibalanus amphitrite TaxID=1232801 RepID=A0A6A4VR56_AMPAM|nr:Stress-induced-phosphoprotein 1 [Amphibalanus amphitrite]